jgi:hypothetical protein
LFSLAVRCEVCYLVGCVTFAFASVPVWRNFAKSIGINQPCGHGDIRKHLNRRRGEGNGGREEAEESCKINKNAFFHISFGPLAQTTSEGRN